MNELIKQDIIDEANSKNSRGLLQKSTKVDNPETNETKKKKIKSTFDNHNDSIELLPRSTRRKTKNTAVSRLYDEENYEIDIIGENTFVGFVHTTSHSFELTTSLSFELIAQVNSELL